jgi:hypothetical protein
VKPRGYDGPGYDCWRRHELDTFRCEHILEREHLEGGGDRGIALLVYSMVQDII